MGKPITVVKLSGTVTIAGISGWYDLGSDVDWESYGGTWGRPDPTEAEPDRWAVIRLDENPGEDDESVAVGVHVRVSEVTDSDLQTCDVPLDGRDEYGEQIPDVIYAGEKVRAYIHTWGAHGVAGGEEYANKKAAVSRAHAARDLCGET